MEEKDFTQDIEFGNNRTYLISNIKEVVAPHINDLERLEQEMMGLVYSKISHLKIVKKSEGALGKVLCIVAKDVATVSNLHDSSSHDIVFGDIVLASGDAPVEISGNCLVFDFYISPTPKRFGQGKSRFEVTATINDKYTITVNADSAEDAVKIANDIPIDNWAHPTIEPHLKERQIVRYARWGNLSAVEAE